MIRPVLLTLVMLVACTSTPTPDSAPVAPVAARGITADATGRCMARTDPPTRTEVVTETIEVEPAIKDRNGVVTRPAIFRQVTRPRTTATGAGTPFETICPQIYTTDFVETLQRALIVRRAYSGPVTGTYDAATQTAVQTFQRAMGINSGLLALSVARELGIVAVPR